MARLPAGTRGLRALVRTMKSSLNSFGSLCASAHGVGQISFHFEWCPKYRYKMLRKQEYKDFLSGCFAEESEKISVGITDLAILDDHVHMVVCMKPWHSVSRVFQQLKGASSHSLFKKEPKFRLRYPKGSFWSPGKFYRSVGDVDMETTRAYVRAQDHYQTNITKFVAQAA